MGWVDRGLQKVDATWNAVSCLPIRIQGLQKIKNIQKKEHEGVCGNERAILWTYKLGPETDYKALQHHYSMYRMQVVGRVLGLCF